ncbi:MAG: hypothetical protein HY901_16250 [Deltaproteobacteria bacterium]|nr:hypothetical protein [Deltaproteobacteria bacterium]
MLKHILANVIVRRSRKHEHPVEYLESKHVDVSNPFPNDSSCFYGGDEKSNAAIFRLAFRGPKRTPECWMDVRLAGKPIFGLPANPGPEREGFVLGDYSFVCQQPGKVWRIAYQGPLTDEAGNLKQGAIDLTFSATHPLFDYAESTDKRMVAAAIAREKWSREFFVKLKDLSQVHYEQFGQLRGAVRFGEESATLDLLTTRDHSFGSRDWASWDRHYWLSGVTAGGQGFTAVAIRYDFCGPIYAGFVISPDGQSDAIVDCTRLEDISREKVWPQSGSIELRTRAGRRHTLEFARDGVFPYTGDGLYLMKEGIGRFRIDGAPAFGLCEFGFNKARYESRLGPEASPSATLPK